MMSAPQPPSQLPSLAQSHMMQSVESECSLHILIKYIFKMSYFFFLPFAFFKIPFLI